MTYGFIRISLVMYSIKNKLEDGSSQIVIVKEIRNNNKDHVRSLIKQYLNDYKEDIKIDDTYFSLLNSDDYRDLIILAGLLGLSSCNY